MSQYIIAIDQGTTSSRAVLFDDSAKLLDFEQLAFKQFYPHDGWVEHDPEEIWKSVVSVTEKLVRKNNIEPSSIKGIGITNQRETTVVWERKTGEPIYPAIVWQDRRTSEVCAEFKSKGYEADITRKTGLLLDPYFSATKLAWILEHVDGARKRAESGELAFGTIDSFLLFKLTEGKSHKTDATNASRTMLFNIEDQCWDEEILSLFGIPSSVLPEVCDTSHDFGETSLLGEPVPITGMIGDQQAALVGQCCFEVGTGKSTYGTGGFLMLNTGKQIVRSQSRLLSTVAYRMGGIPCYAIEGSIFIAGAALKWLGEELGFFASAKISEDLASKANSDSRVVMVPAFTGLGAPHWDPEARGAIYGLTRDTGVPEIVAAALESIAFQTMDLVASVNRDGTVLTEMKVDGGVAANDWFMARLANLLGIPVLRQSVIETTALGACYMAGLGASIFNSLDSLKSNWSLDKRFEPDRDRSKWETKYATWKNCVSRTLSEPKTER